MSENPYIGIDLGTNKTCVAIFEKGKIDIIPNELGERTTPSYVAFSDSQKLIGDPAKTQMNNNPKNTLFNLMRLLGKKYDDPFIQENKKYFPFEIVQDLSSGLAQVQVTYKNEKKKYFIEEILALELQQIKRNASNYLKKEVKDTIISVPNCFNLAQRMIIKDAAAIAGLDAINIIDTSCSIYMYHYLNGKDKNSQKEEKVLIFDLGAGFFNASVLSIEEALLEVKAQTGKNLGGEDFDNKLVEYCAKEFKNKTSKDIFQNPKALMRLKTQCENAKKILSSTSKTNIQLDNLIDGQDLNIEITREKFEQLCNELFENFVPCLENLLKDAKMKKEEINEILLIGGSTRIPKIQSILRDFFNGKKLNNSLNPEENVAYGAAIQAAVSGNYKDEFIENLILLKVIPISLGFEGEGGVMNIILPRNNTIPCKKTIIVKTTEDNQKSFLCKIYEGENQLTKDNHFIGRIKLDGLPLKPKGQVEIEITFDIDAVLYFTITLVELSTGINAKMVMNYEIERLDENYRKKLIMEYQNEYQKNEKEICIEDKVEEIFGWIKSNRNASNDEINNKKKELIDFMKNLI